MNDFSNTHFYNVSTQIHLKFTDFLRDVSSVRYARSNKYLYQYVLKQYKYKKYIHINTLKTNKPILVTKLIIDDLCSEDLSPYQSMITHLRIRYISMPNYSLLINLNFSTFIRLINLEFPDNFNQTIQHLAAALPNLKSLKFGNEFNQSVDNKLPQNLTELSFGRCFNQSIDNLPLSLISLDFSCSCEFNQSVSGLSRLLSLTHIYHLVPISINP